MARIVTQGEFSSLNGHMVNGTEIQMRNGDVCILKRVAEGWQLHRNDTPFMVPTKSAHVIECVVFSYPEDIGP